MAIFINVILFLNLGWNIQTALEPDVHGAWGDWGELALCPNMTYAYAFALKVSMMINPCPISGHYFLKLIRYCHISKMFLKVFKYT